MELAESLSRAVDANSARPTGHSMRVALRSIRVAEALDLSEDDKAVLRLASLLHDIGKTRIPHDVLHKPGPLTDAEFALIQRHPVEGAAILEPLQPSVHLSRGFGEVPHQFIPGHGYLD